MNKERLQSLKRDMIAKQLKKRGITDSKVLNAFLNVDRHLFVPEKDFEYAYEDRPLPIGEGQTISQPYMVALMVELLGLKGNETILEIGTGSGYQTVILSKLAKMVYSIERITLLARKAEETLHMLGIKNTQIITGDGSVGLSEKAPFDAIIVSASAPAIPLELINQLAKNGNLVIPVGSRFLQQLILIKKDANGSLKKINKGGCVFVPLIGKKGWK